MLNHILTNWKTSAAGVLIAVGVVCGVLTQQGITLGNAGTGTVVALIAAVAAALLGLVAKDPGNQSPVGTNGLRDEGTKTPSTTQKLGALLLCALLLPATWPTTGCTISQAQVVADGNALAAALTSTAKVLSESDPATAQRLLTAANAISAVTSNWQGVSSEAVLNAAAAGAEVVLAAIPQTSIVASLLPIAVAALDVVLANTVPAGTSAVLRVNAEEMNNLSAYRTAPEHAIHHRWMRSPAGDFRAAWDAQCVRANLRAAEI